MNYLHLFNDYKVCKDLARKALDTVNELHDYAYKQSSLDYTDKRAVSAASEALYTLWWILDREMNRIHSQLLNED